MPAPILAALPAITNAAGGFTNMMAQDFQNRQSQRWSEKMYQRQFDDNVNFWHLQNSYNTPQAQMQRFTEAGLNPNLVYSQGNPGNAAQIQSPSVQPAQFRSSNPGDAMIEMGANTLQSYYDIRMKDAQISNMEEQNNLLQLDARLKQLQLDSGTFDYNFKSDLRDTNMQFKSESLRKLQQDIQLQLNKDGREAALNATTIDKALEEMKSLQQGRAQSRAEIKRIEETTRGLKADNYLKQLDTDLRKQGINPNDPLWSRVVGRALSDLFDPSKDTKQTPSIMGMLKHFGW